MIRKADLSIINLECVIAEDGEMWDKTRKAFYFRADPFAIDVLKAADISYVSLANNHILDFKEPALLETISRLDDAGIAHAGAGKNLAEATRYALIEANGIRVGVVAFTDNEPLFGASDDQSRDKLHSHHAGGTCLREGQKCGKEGPPGF